MRKEYRDAGYHLQASGDHHKPFNAPSADSALLGVYDSTDGELVIEHLAEGPSTLPELKLSFESGRIITVACEGTAREYLKMFGARKSRRKQRHQPARLVLDHWRE